MPSARAQRTRDHLQEVALELIAERGYERTTVEQIADAAGVSHMTFFRHFPTKESVVLDDPFDPALAAAVAAAPTDLPPLLRVCRGLRAVVELLQLPDQEQVRARVRIGAGTPSLVAGMWANTVATQDVVARALAPGGESEPGLPERVAAAAAVAALTTGVLAWSLGDDDGPLSGRLVDALDVLDPEGSHNRA
ncbi:MAG: helix-turn-helix domain-containing protein [Candidatus Nanopelagicales bacterium]